MNAASLKGKPTLINFYFADCVPCILEVGPLNSFAAGRPGMNFLAVTFDEAAVARAFVARYNFRWRVVPDAREFIDRVRVKQYPTMALFDENGRLLGTRQAAGRAMSSRRPPWRRSSRAGWMGCCGPQDSVRHRGACQRSRARALTQAYL